MISGRYQLHGRPGTGSAPVEAALALGGFDAEIIDVPADHLATGHDLLMALNPLGQVPTLVLPDGTVMTESAAILIHLADSAAPGLLGPVPGSSGRPGWLRAMLFLAATLYPDFLLYYYPHRYAGLEGSADALREAAEQRLERNWATFARFCPESTSPGVLELYAATLMAWNPDAGRFATLHPPLAEMARTVAALPGVVPVWQRHGYAV